MPVSDYSSLGVRSRSEIPTMVTDQQHAMGLPRCQLTSCWAHKSKAGLWICNTPKLSNVLKAEPQCRWSELGLGEGAGKIWLNWWINPLTINLMTTKKCRSKEMGLSWRCRPVGACPWSLPGGHGTVMDYQGLSIITFCLILDPEAIQWLKYGPKPLRP